MFWLDNLNILTIPLLIPDINMTFEDKLNAIIRGLLFLGIIFTLVFNDSKYILFVLIIMIISIIIYNYQIEKNNSNVVQKDINYYISYKNGKIEFYVRVKLKR
jgi:predicted membrane protein